MPELCPHAQKRAAQRNISVADIGYIVVYGKRYHRAGARIYYLRKRDIPFWDQNDPQYTRLNGTAVILTKDGRQVITVWRNRKNGVKNIRKKPRHSWQ